MDLRGIDVCSWGSGARWRGRCCLVVIDLSASCSVRDRGEERGSGCGGGDGGGLGTICLSREVLRCLQLKGL